MGKLKQAKKAKKFRVIAGGAAAPIGSRAWFDDRDKKFDELYEQYGRGDGHGQGSDEAYGRALLDFGRETVRLLSRPILTLVWDEDEGACSRDFGGGHIPIGTARAGKPARP